MSESIEYSQFENELKEEVRHFLFLMGTIFGDEPVARLMDRADQPGFAIQHADIDLSRFDLASHAAFLYEYAIHGRLLVGWAVPHIDDALRALDVICRTNESVEGPVGSAVNAVWKKAFARAALDFVRAEAGVFDEAYVAGCFVGTLGIEDVAYLCDMTPASVRNSTMSNAKDRLLTERVEGRVIVDNASLLDWLSRRRAYRETVVEEYEVPENARFHDKEGLVQFVMTRIKNRKIKVKPLAKALQMPEKIVAQWVLTGTSPDVSQWDIDTVIGFAKYLDLPGSEFVSRASAILVEEKAKAAGLMPKAEVVPFSPKRR